MGSPSSKSETLPSGSGILLVLSAPLGVGKRTLCQAFLDRQPNARLSVSQTTRPRGPREVDGYDFSFVTEPMFQKEVAAGEFLEHVKIHDHFFGTPRTPIFENLAAGRDVLLDVNTQGARDVKKAVPEAVLVFVCPPTLEALVARLDALDPNRPDILPTRLARARQDIGSAMEYDYVILNDNLVETAEELSAILHVEHRRATRRQKEIRKLVESPSPALP
ncbi:MAG: guanylate kinase [Elusimicrobia bacterium]|jgi:guanylate kinase|nr:guanylate kinase [Elusimicrobiota bacterium]